MEGAGSHNGFDKCGGGSAEGVQSRGQSRGRGRGRGEGDEVGEKRVGSCAGLGGVDTTTSCAFCALSRDNSL